MGAGAGHAIGTFIFFQFRGALRVVSVYHFCSSCRALRIVLIEWGGDCNTPFLTSFALNIYDTYIVNNHSPELKEKAPPSIWLCYVSDINCHRWYMGTCGIHIKVVASCSYAF